MPVTMEEVLAQLDKEEPDYVFAASELGEDALPHLRQLVLGENVGRASKAVCLASLIKAEESATILSIASKSNASALRAAAAISLGNLDIISIELGTQLLNDEDVGTRKWALRALEKRQSPGFKSKVNAISTSDPDPMLRDIARRLVDQLQ